MPVFFLPKAVYITKIWQALTIWLYIHPLCSPFIHNLISFMPNNYFKVYLILSHSNVWLQRSFLTICSWGLFRVIELSQLLTRSYKLESWFHLLPSTNIQLLQNLAGKFIDILFTDRHHISRNFLNKFI